MQTLPVALAMVAPIAIVLCGILPVRIRNARSAIIWEGAIRFATIIWGAFYFIFLGPAFRNTFENFGTELPSLTVLLLKLFALDKPLSQICFVFFEMALIATVGIFAFLRREETTVSSAKWLSIAVTGIFTFGYVLILCGLFLPLIKLLNDLS